MPGEAMSNVVDDSDKKAGRCDMSICRKVRVALLAVLLILVMTLQVVCFKKAGYSYGPYPYMILITVGFAFIPICFGIVGIIHCRTGGFVPEITTCRYKIHYCIIGMFNAINGVLIIFSNPHVSGILQAILAQAVIPFTLVLSVVWLRTRYSVLQYIGAAIVIGGVVVSLVPTFDTSASSGNSTAHRNASTAATMTGFGGALLGDSNNNQAVIWAVLFTLGQLPSACLSIYQEKMFAESAKEVNVFYMMSWAMLSQWVLLAVAFPINFVPWFGAISVDDAGGYLTNATVCLFNLTGAAPQCGFALLDLGLCVLTMLGTNLVQAFLVKYSSAVLMMFIITLVTPVTAIAFTFKFLMGDDVETVNVLEIVALLVLMAGICIYRWKAIVAVFRPLQSAAAVSLGDEDKKRASGLSEPLTSRVLASQTYAESVGDGLSDMHELVNTRASLITTDAVAGGIDIFDRGTQRLRSRSAGGGSGASGGSRPAPVATLTHLEDASADSDSFRAASV
jgi:drug/metabolite transporter (DMT)-like permease